MSRVHTIFGSEQFVIADAGTGTRDRKLLIVPLTIRESQLDSSLVASGEAYEKVKLMCEALGINDPVERNAQGKVVVSFNRMFKETNTRHIQSFRGLVKFDVEKDKSTGQFYTENKDPDVLVIEGDLDTFKFLPNHPESTIKIFACAGVGGMFAFSYINNYKSELVIYVENARTGYLGELNSFFEVDPKTNLKENRELKMANNIVLAFSYLWGPDEVIFRKEEGKKYRTISTKWYCNLVHELHSAGHLPDGKFLMKVTRDRTDPNNKKFEVCQSHTTIGK